MLHSDVHLFDLYTLNSTEVIMSKEISMERIVAEIPTNLKRRAASKAAMHGRPLKEVIEQLLEQWLNEDIELEPELPLAA